MTTDPTPPSTASGGLVSEALKPLAAFAQQIDAIQARVPTWPQPPDEHVIARQSGSSDGSIPEARLTLGDARRARNALAATSTDAATGWADIAEDALPARELDRLEALARAASPGPWDYDRVQNEGDYGFGRTSSGFSSYAVQTEDGKTLIDTLNSDTAMVREEYDEYGVSAWDSVGRANAEHIAAFDPPTTLKLIAIARRRMSALPSAGEVGTGNALTLRWTIGIGKDGSVYDDTETFGNSFAEVYAGFHAIKAELERQIAARRECPFNPVNPQPPVFTNAAETGSGDAPTVHMPFFKDWRDDEAPPAPPVVEAGARPLDPTGRPEPVVMDEVREVLVSWGRDALIPLASDVLDAANWLMRTHSKESATPLPAPVAQAEEALGEEEMRLLTLWADQASTSIYGVPNAPKRLIAAARASRVTGAEGALREGVWKTTTIRKGEPDLVQWRAWSKRRGEVGMFTTEDEARSALNSDWLGTGLTDEMLVRASRKAYPGDTFNSDTLRIGFREGVRQALAARPSAAGREGAE